MPDMLTDGNIKVTYVPTIANTAAPTTAELAAGTALECIITADGLDFSVDEETVSIPKLCETITAEAPGRVKYGVSLTMVRKTTVPEDVAWTTLIRGLTGYLVIRYNLPVATAYASAQKVQVFPGAFGERKQQKPEANSAVKFMSQFFVNAQPKPDAAVA